MGLLCISCRFLPTGAYSICTSSIYLMLVNLVDVYGICRMRRYRWNILQWEENYIKCMKRPTGDYYLLVNQNLRKLALMCMAKITDNKGICSALCSVQHALEPFCLCMQNYGSIFPKNVSNKQLYSK